MSAFKELGLSSWLISSLQTLGITRPSPVQTESIPVILSPQQKHVFACSRTGTGKTLAYLLPIVELLARDPRPYFALIMAPTRELAYQINDMIRALASSSVKSLLIIGGTDDGEESRGLWFGKPNIVVATPGKVLDHFTNRNFIDVCGQKNTLTFNMLVLDEADQLISTGFCQQMKDILAFLDSVKTNPMVTHRRQTLVFSATLTQALEQLKELVMRKDPNQQPVIINLLPTVDEIKVELSTNPDLQQRYILCPQLIKCSYLIECILDIQFTQLIVFCATKREAKLIHSVLITLGFAGNEFNLNPVLLNSNMRQNLRFAAIDMFRSCKSKVLVTTDLANRGLDLPQVDLIINYNCPKSAVTYVHRVGRTCRKPDFRDGQIYNNQITPVVPELEMSTDMTIEKKRFKKNKKKDDKSLQLKRRIKKQSPASLKYAGKSITFVTQYDINLFKSIESFIGIKMEKETSIDEENVNSIMKQVTIAIKEAQIRIEHEESEDRHLENLNRNKSKRKLNTKQKSDSKKSKT